MSEEPSLPRLPAVSWDERSQSFSNNPRKRVRGQSSKNPPTLAMTSSDPAVFSSDDDPSLDNYVEGRRKKRYVGSWFQQQPASSDSAMGEPCTVSNKPKRTLARKVDSGVFMGSDGAESDDMLESLEMAVRPKLPQLEQRPVRQISKAEMAAREKIRTCLEQGDETIDFYSMGLEEISNDTISQLSNFSCIPMVAKDVAFEQKEPKLEVYLSNNWLTWIPGALFDLSHLTILSLRGNQLTELPPAISKLTNLTQLNVGQNRLRYLPTGLLDLLKPGGNLRELVLHPNPFVKPDTLLGDKMENGTVAAGFSSLFKTDDVSGGPPVNLTFISRHLGRSHLQLSDSGGRILSDFKLSPDETSGILVVASATNGTSVPPPSSSSSAAILDLKEDPSKFSAAPSLLEVALRSCYQSEQLSNLKYYLSDTFSQLGDLLERATRQKGSGGLFCSRCARLVVVPTAEWVEWREISTCSIAGTTNILSTHPLTQRKGEVPVPFLYRACSWRCAVTELQKEDVGWGLPEGCVPV